jgi:hypothetical protein
MKAVTVPLLFVQLKSRIGLNLQRQVLFLVVAIVAGLRPDDTHRGGEALEGPVLGELDRNVVLTAFGSAMASMASPLGKKARTWLPCSEARLASTGSPPPSPTRTMLERSISSRSGPWIMALTVPWLFFHWVFQTSG